MEIKNCSALISGGASGMGEATARLLSAAGAKVTIIDTNTAALERVANDIQGLALTCNITEPDAVNAALQQASAIHGPIRICINCAGIVKGQRMVSRQGPMPLAVFREVIDVNLIGTFNVMSLVAAEMMKHDPLPNTEERGVIINTASIAAFEGQIGQTAYSASKGGVVSLTLPAARELGPFGIRVMTIAPGLVETPMLNDISAEVRASLAEAIPFPKRLAQPIEYAKLALHIIENVMLNGTVIRLDGALRMQAK